MQASSQAIRLAHVRAHIEAAEDPVRVFAHEYDQGDADTQDALYAVWESKFMSRAEDPSLAERRFDLYLSLGRRSKPRRTAKAIRDAVGLASGARTKYQFLLGKTAPFRMPEWMWVVVYKTRMRLVSLAAQAAVAADPAMALLAPMVYIGHRRDSVVVWDRVRLSDARRRTRSANGLVELTRLLLGAGLSHGAGGDFVFDEFYQEELDVPALRRKLAEARAVLGRKRGAYTRIFMRDEVGRRDLPKPGVTEDGLGQTRAAQLTQPQRAARLRAMNAAAV
eukprot:jgi/Tetstr1/459625/TSEL_004981.t1